jgi:hypothetical protein
MRPTQPPTTPTNPNHRSVGHGMTLGLPIALGLGIPLALALCVGGYFMARRMRNGGGGGEGGSSVKVVPRNEA